MWGTIGKFVMSKVGGGKNSGSGKGLAMNMMNQQEEEPQVRTEGIPTQNVQPWQPAQIRTPLMGSSGSGMQARSPLMGGNSQWAPADRLKQFMQMFGRR
jgi:hypothetical protein